MRAIQSLRHAGRLIIFSGAVLCAMLVCVAFRSAASLRKSAEPRNESAPFAAGQADCDQLRKTVQQLTAELDQFKRKGPGLDKHSQIDYLRDLLIEADFWARKEDAAAVVARHVEKALEQKVFRSNLIAERIKELIDTE